MPAGLAVVPKAACRTSTDGISVVQVAGTSTQGTFQLAGDGAVGGTPFEHHLYAYGPGSPNGLAAVDQRLVSGSGAYWDYRLQSVYEDPGGDLPPVPELPFSPDPSPPQPPPGSRLAVAPQVPSYLTAPLALFNAQLQTLDSLHRRLDAVRDDPVREGESEVFLRSFGGQYDYTTNRGFTVR